MSEPNISIAWVGGNCPVQAEGTIDGAVFYFQARGKRWSLTVATDAGGVDGPNAWEHSERYSDDEYAAGWMSEDEARRFIAKGAKLYDERANTPEESGG
jgi:hypothetical protein